MLLRRRCLPFVLLLRRRLPIAPCHVRRRLPVALAPAVISTPESCLVVLIPALLVVVKVLKGVLRRCESIVD